MIFTLSLGPRLEAWLREVRARDVAGADLAHRHPDSTWIKAKTPPLRRRFHKCEANRR